MQVTSTANLPTNTASAAVSLASRSPHPCQPRAWLDHTPYHCGRRKP
ncbi:TPA: hypothetical protein ACFU11_001408 [Neisseria subflava]